MLVSGWNCYSKIKDGPSLSLLSCESSLSKKALIENPLGAADAQIAKSSRRESIGLSEIQNVLEILFNPRFLLMSA